MHKVKSITRTITLRSMWIVSFSLNNLIQSILQSSVENLSDFSRKVGKVVTFAPSRFFGEQKSHFFKKSWSCDFSLKIAAFPRKSWVDLKNRPSLQSAILKGKKRFFYVIWQIHLLEEEEKGLRRPPTPLEAFKHHLPSQSRIFVEQVFKIPHRYVHFIPLFFYLFHGLFERFLAFSLAYLFAIFFSILPLISMPQKWKTVPM